MQRNHRLVSIVVAACALVYAGEAAAQAILVDYRGVYRERAPGVVFIAALMDGNQGATGTGSIITKQGHIITNAHVIWDEKNKRVAPRIFVFMKPKRVNGDNKNDLQHQFPATVLQYDNAMDLAVLKMQDPPAGMTLIPFMDSEFVEVGSPTVAIGHPEQGVRWTMTTGAISGFIDNFNQVQGKHVLQMETSVNRGNSGGPLLDHKGNMIGINSMIARVGAGGLAITSINFAIRADVAKQWLAQFNIFPQAEPVAYDYMDKQEAAAVVASAAPPPQGGNREAQADQAPPPGRVAQAEPPADELPKGRRADTGRLQGNDEGEQPYAKVVVHDDERGDTTISNRQKLDVNKKKADKPRKKTKRKFESKYQGVEKGEEYTESEIDQLKERMKKFEKEVDRWGDDLERGFERQRKGGAKTTGGGF